MQLLVVLEIRNFDVSSQAAAALEKIRPRQFQENNRGPNCYLEWLHSSQLTKIRTHTTDVSYCLFELPTLTGPVLYAAISWLVAWMVVLY